MKLLLDLLAGVALLVWGTHLVRTGILRQYGGSLRRFLRRSITNRAAAFVAGLGVTSLLQSSTATALIVAAFAGQGLIATAPALAVMLGADVGTSLVTLVLSFDLGFLAPVLVIAGVTLFLRRQDTAVGRFGRILIGLGLILFALQWIRTAAQPVVATAGVKVLFQSLTGDTMLDVLVGAIFAIGVYSSLAVVLLVATFTQLGLVSLQVAFGIVLGANLGSGALAMLSTMQAEPEARRVTLGNFLFKLAGCVLMIPLVGWMLPLVEPLGFPPEQQVVYFHLAFNIAMAVLFLGFTGPFARIAERLLPTPPTPENGTRPRFLDASALETPALAIGNAARETLRIADTIDEMLRGMMDVLRNNDRDLAVRLRRKDDVVDELYTAVKLYLAQVPRGALDERESRRWADIISYAINLEQVGDIIERILDDIENRKIDKGRSFSDAGMTEIVDLHSRLVANLRLSTSVFLHGDRKSAQELLAQKVLIRDLERAYAASHLERLAGNTIESIETSSLHLDLISDLRRINSHFCSVAYPILEEAGVLAKTRLRNLEDVPIGDDATSPPPAAFGKDAPRGI
ncbi:MAG TPA: Na/Pi cotransporter family protein [Casimicrobiaceae bacterium]|nr:Na/Pi cotransporter family protein [Casimicrobiaceae bacterium]